MLVIKGKEVPRKAGKAIIRLIEDAGGDYYAGDGSALDEDNPAIRNGKDIFLLDDELSVFIPLLDGKQFLYTCGVGEERGYYFGGTDEEPFLVRLTKTPFFNYEVCREEGFFFSLVPKIVNQFHLYFKLGFKRQGDIFYMPLNASWGGLMAMYGLMGGNRGSVRKAEDFSIYDTRHLLTGESLWLLGCKDGEDYLLAKGTIYAPDHDPVNLKKISLLAQTQYLFDPRKAD